MVWDQILSEVYSRMKKVLLLYSMLRRCIIKMHLNYTMEVKKHYMKCFMAQLRNLRIYLSHVNHPKIFIIYRERLSMNKRHFYIEYAS